jgi:hypothetical protein
MFLLELKKIRAMDNFQIIDHCKYYSDDQIKEEISGA